MFVPTVCKGIRGDYVREVVREVVMEVLGMKGGGYVYSSRFRCYLSAGGIVCSRLSSSALCRGVYICCHHQLSSPAVIRRLVSPICLANINGHPGVTDVEMYSRLMSPLLQSFSSSPRFSDFVIHPTVLLTVLLHIGVSCKVWHTR